MMNKKKITMAVALLGIVCYMIATILWVTGVDVRLVIDEFSSASMLFGLAVGINYKTILGWIGYEF